MMIRSARLKVQMPVHCHLCAAMAFSEVKTVELVDIEVTELQEALAALRIGSHHPIGWGCFAAWPNTVYRCPACVQRTTSNKGQP